MNKQEIYKINDVVTMRYYAIPQELFENPLYANLNLAAKILYAFLLDRLTLSQQHNWVNQNNEVYLIFTREEAMKKLNISKPTITNAFKQLVANRLIIEQRQSLGRPNLIFVCKILSRHVKSTHQET